MMSKTRIIEVLAEVAAAAAGGSSAHHPEDIAAEMAGAVEHAAITLSVIAEKDNFA